MTTSFDVDDFILPQTAFERRLPKEEILRNDDDDSDFEEEEDDDDHVTDGEKEQQETAVVDAVLFRGLMRILLDRSKTEAGHGAVDYEALSRRAAEHKDKQPEVSWFFRNLHYMKKFEESDSGLLESSVRRGLGHVGMLQEMLRRCLLLGRHRQAAFVVWALAAFTRDALTNKLIPIIVLRTVLEIFLTRDGSRNDGDDELPNFAFSSLEKFVDALLSVRQMDPRESGVEWLLMLLSRDRYRDATEVFDKVEASRRKQYHSKIADPRAQETKDHFQALSGLACAIYVEKLRSSPEERTLVSLNPSQSQKKNVTFFDSILEDDFSYHRADKTCEEIRADELVLNKRENEAKLKEDQAIKDFETVIFKPGSIWDGFVAPYVALVRRREGDEAAVEELIKYRRAHPDNPNAHRFLYQFLEELDDDSLDESQWSLSLDALRCYNRLCPMDKEAAVTLLDRLEEDEAKEKEAESSFSFPEERAEILFDLLDYPEHKLDVVCWQLLVKVLGKVEKTEDATPLARVSSARDFFVSAWFEGRADWWPGMHFSVEAADRDVAVEERAALIKVKLKFVKFVKVVSRDVAFSDFGLDSEVERSFSRYKKRISRNATT